MQTAGVSSQTAIRWSTGLIAMVSLAVPAAEPPAPPVKIDWAHLNGLLWAGDYEKASLVADEIATAVQPVRRDPNYLARSVESLRALMRRGFAETRLGHLDAAAKSLEMAAKVLKDREFQRLLNLEARNASARFMSSMVQLDINRVELFELRKAVIVERLRLLNLELVGSGARTKEEDEGLRSKVGDWLDEYDVLERNAREAREALAERLEKAGEAVLASPYNRAVVGEFRPALLAAVRALELGRLPCGDPRASVGDTATAVDVGAASVSLEAAERDLRKASDALDAAIVAVAPKGLADLKTQPKIEASLLRCDLLISEGEVLLARGDSARARERLEQAIQLRTEAAALQRVASPEVHADLFWPLVLLAEAMLDEARRGPAGGDPAGSRGRIVAADKILMRADGLPIASNHPLRERLKTLRARIDREVRAADAKIPGRDDADVAARRVRRAIDRTAAIETAVEP